MTSNHTQREQTDCFHDRIICRARQILCKSIFLISTKDTRALFLRRKILKFSSRDDDRRAFPSSWCAPVNCIVEAQKLMRHSRFRLLRRVFTSAPESPALDVCRTPLMSIWCLLCSSTLGQRLYVYAWQKTTSPKNCSGTGLPSDSFEGTL